MSFLDAKPGVPLLESDDLVRHYDVNRGIGKPGATVKALDGVSFALETQKTLAVVGESGCGKSTLGRQLTLIEKPTSGALKLNGTEVGDLTDKEAKQFRRTVQMIFQNPYGSLNPRKKVGQILAEPVLLNMDSLAARSVKNACAPPWQRLACVRNSISVIRICFPVVSVSVSRLPVP